MTDALMHPGEDVRRALNKAYDEWKSWENVGKKFIYFEHHCDVYFGCTFVYNYTARRFSSWRITNEQKYLLFLMKFL